MGIIAISRGSYTKGKTIAEKLAQRVGYQCISREVLLKASEDFSIPEENLLRAIEDAPSFLDRITRGKEKYITFFRASLYNSLKLDNVVYHGFAYHFFLGDIPHVLKVRIITDLEDRLAMVMERDDLSRKGALRFIEKIDQQRSKWGRKLYGIDVSDPNLYDLVLNTGRITEEDATDVICRMAELPRFQTTSASKKAMEDLALAAEVETHLFNVRPRVEVCIDNGFISLKTEAQVSQDSQLVNKIEEIMKMIPGVKGIKVVSSKDPDDRSVCIAEAGGASTEGGGPTFFTELG
ncbi:MAG: cytidylate kinase-like family protein [Deltaproteobacteria bacterium]|nr:cytidylate kinase-like family protein [Deltaproteobacteria bacterium]